MHVSVVIPTYNEASSVSVIKQNIHLVSSYGWETIIVDGGSTDDTLAQLELQPDLCLVSAKGRSIQQNTGACYASGEIMLFLHADTLLPPDTYQQIEQFHKQIKQKCWARFAVSLSGQGIVFRVIERLMNFRTALTSIVTGDHVFVVSRDLFGEVGGFDSIGLMEDIALSKKLKKTSPVYCFSSQVITSSRRWEAHGVVKTIVLMWSLRLAYFFGVSPNTLKKVYK